MVSSRQQPLNNKSMEQGSMDIQKRKHNVNGE